MRIINLKPYIINIMKAGLLNIVVLYLLTSCINTSGSNPCEDTRKDTLFINEKCVLIISPTLNELERIRQKYNTEEDFFVMADDAANYNVTAIEYVEQNDIPIIYVDTLIRVLNFNCRYSIDISDTLQVKNPLWQIVYYEQNQEPQIIESIDVEKVISKCNNQCFSMTKYKYTGTWAISEEQQSPYIAIHEDSTAYMVVENDQINIVVKLVRDDNNSNKFKLLLLNPAEELGMGGQKLSWNDYSKSVPVANITFESDSKAQLDWRGFYNVLIKQREWEECQFTREKMGDSIQLIKLR